MNGTGIEEPRSHELALVLVEIYEHEQGHEGLTMRAGVRTFGNSGNAA